MFSKEGGVDQYGVFTLRTWGWQYRTQRPSRAGQEDLGPHSQHAYLLLPGPAASAAHPGCLASIPGAFHPREGKEGSHLHRHPLCATVATPDCVPKAVSFRPMQASNSHHTSTRETRRGHWMVPAVLKVLSPSSRVMASGRASLRTSRRLFKDEDCRLRG